MECSYCRFENPEGTRFCGNCGTPLIEKDARAPFQTKTLQTPSDALKRGTLFAGRYEIIEQLGAGGMGKVYRAYDKLLNEEVAIKLLKPDIASDHKTLERFRHELKVARQIIHRNVCRMHDFHEEGKTPFISMEYVRGENLKSLIKRAEKLTPGKAVSIANQVGHGLAEAHRMGVVHRDLKPQNIMVDKEGNARIMDFGIARSLRAEGITEEGMIIGTPEYLSPEQVKGYPTDQRSDIYALGTVLFEMVTGCLPFEGTTPLSIALKHRDAPVKDPREINPQVPTDLSRIILKCLAKEKEKRFQTAEELLEALKRVETGVHTDEKLVSKADTSPVASRRRIQPFLIPISLVLAAALVIAGYFLIRRRPLALPLETEVLPGAKLENSIAVLPFRDFSPQRDQEYFCDGMTDAIIGKLHRLGGLKVISLTSVLAYKNADRNLTRIGQELDVKAILEGSIQKESKRIRVSAQLIKVADDSHLWSNTFDREVESVFEVQDEISMAIAGALEVKLKPDVRADFTKDRPGSLEGYDHYMKGMYFIKSRYVLSFKEEDFQAGVEMFHKALDVDPDFSQAYFGLAWAFEHHYHVTQNPTDSGQGFEMAEKGYQLNPDSALLNAGLGYFVYTYQRDFDQGFQLLKTALGLNPDIGEVNFLVGTCYLYHGLYKKGIEYLSKSVALDPYYFWAPYKLATCYMNTGQDREAAYYFDRYFELAPVLFMFPGRPISLYIKMKRYDRVEDLLTHTEEINPDYWGLPYCKALLLAAQGKSEEALALYQNSEIYSLSGMKDEALRHLEKEIRGSAWEPYIFYLHLLNNPFYNNLRGDPRFEAIVAREKILYEDHLKKYGIL